MRRWSCTPWTKRYVITNVEAGVRIFDGINKKWDVIVTCWAGSSKIFNNSGMHGIIQVLEIWHTWSTTWPAKNNYSLVITTERHLQWVSHKSTPAVTKFSQTCGITNLHIPILYLITVNINCLIE